VCSRLISVRNHCEIYPGGARNRKLWHCNFPNHVVRNHCANNNTMQRFECQTRPISEALCFPTSWRQGIHFETSTYRMGPRHKMLKPTQMLPHPFLTICPSTCIIHHVPPSHFSNWLISVILADSKIFLPLYALVWRFLSSVDNRHSAVASKGTCGLWASPCQSWHP
jgi:hypothetical protein